MADEQQVEVYSPKGQRGTIPASQVDEATKPENGYKRADSYIRAIHPTTGKTGLIPKEQWGDAQMQGYILDPRDEAKIKQRQTVQMGKAPLNQSISGLLPDRVPDPKTGIIPPEPSDAEAAGAIGNLPGAVGALGGAVAGVPGATIGGSLGESARQFLAPLANIPRAENVPQDVAEEGALQGAFEGTGKVAEKALTFAAQKLAPGLIKNLIKPSEKMFAYGKDPVAAVMNMDRGIPTNKAELAKQVFQELEDTGNVINSKIQAVEKAFPNAPSITKLDVGRAINDPIDKKIAEVSADRGMEASLKKGVIEKLEDLRKGIMSDNAGKQLPTVLKLSEANTLKQQIGKGANWKTVTDAVESKAQPILNGLRKEIYSNIRQGIEQQADRAGVTGIKEANLKYGSLLDAQKAIEKKLNTGPVLIMSDLVTALASPAAAGVKKLTESTPGAITLSKVLRAGGRNAKGGGVGVSALLRVIAGLVESNADNSSQTKQGEL